MYFCVLFQGNTHKNLNIAVEVMRRIHSLIGNYLDLLKENDYLQIVKCLRYLGFDNLVATSEYTKVICDKILIDIYLQGRGLGSNLLCSGNMVIRYLVCFILICCEDNGGISQVGTWHTPP